jgi:class 3 adenylate cyclase/predicted ATPase
MGNVAAWLQGLGLGKYVKDFEDNEIDLDALPHLTESMLDKIGLPIGPKAKLLAAIARLSSSAAPATEAQREHAERRQITVMFCDLVDSTRLASCLDPEDLRLVMQAYQRACTAIIGRYEGHVARYLGDGILAYFGWPAAHEDAADRAVRAGLEIVEAVKSLAGPEPLLVRIGISTGIVVIDEAGPGDPPVSDAVGETLHVAARLQNLASPNSVVISESTHRLVSARFDQEELGPYDLKGVPVPVHVFRVRRVRESSRRFLPANVGELTPLVGRRVELACLREHWRNAKDGDGNVVFVSGVPGIGKSRIVHELEKSIETEAHFSLSFQCLPYCTESAFFPIIQQIERFADLTYEDSDEVKLDKIAKLLLPATDHPDQVVPFVAEMLAIPIESRYDPIVLSPQRVKAHILLLLVDLLLGLSNNGPVFCLVEDAQWLDPSTQELLDLAVAQIAKARVLLVVTHRPEYQRHPSSYGNVSELTIPRLERRAVVELVQLALRNQPTSTAVVNRIIDESDSIPLFVEELARGVIGSTEANVNGLAGQHTSPSASWVVPDSLRDSLVARLDRAPQARNVAQIAAVVGREFSYNMLLRVSSLSKSELDLALSHLQENEIVYLIHDRSSPRYAFKHALLRDVAYDSLLKSNRREFHSRVASTISEEWPEIASSQPELLAYHYSLGGNIELAMQYWLLGGQHARDQYANLEATGLYQKALECLRLLPEVPERRETELEIQLSLGLCFIAVRGYSAHDTRQSFERACELSAGRREPKKELQAIFGLWGHYWMIARHDRAIELGETLLAKAAALGDPITLIVGHRSLGSTLFTFGDFVQARDHLEQAVALGQATNIGGAFLSYAVDPRIASLLMLAWDLWILGYPEQAVGKVLQALSQAGEPAAPYTVAFAHYVTSVVRLLRGEAKDSLAHAEQSSAVSQEYRINLYATYSRFGRGCALAQMGQQKRAIDEIRDGIAEAERSKLGYMRPFMLGWLADLQAQTEHAEAALLTIDETLKEINDVKGRAWEAELHRLRGTILLSARPDAVDAVEDSYRYAMAIAQRQRARSLELRAATSLSRLLHIQNRNQEARSLLAPIYRWFTEGFDTLDLKEAKALLDELAD